MDAKTLLDLLMGQCNRTSPEFRAKCLDEMTLVQRDRLEKRAELPWFLITEEATTVTVPDDKRLFLPSDFIREVEEKNLVYVEADGNELEMGKVGHDEGLLTYDDTAKGPPHLYSIRGEYIILRPIPDAVYTIRFPAYFARQQPPVDSLTFENAWMKEAPLLLLNMTGVVMASKYIKDMELAQAFAAGMKDADKELNDAITAREEANRDRRMG